MGDRLLPTSWASALGSPEDLRPRRSIGLLATNWEAGDEALVERLLQQDREALHALGLGLRHVVESQGSPALVPALLVGYERTPCSLCREAYVKELVRLDELPAELRLECRWDARQETRDLVSSPTADTTV